MGAAQLRPPRAHRAIVRWTYDKRLRLFAEDGELLAHLDGERQQTLRATNGWRVDWAKEHAGIRLFSESPCVQHRGGPEAGTFPCDFRLAFEALPETTRELIRAFTRAAGPACELHPRRARSWLGVPARATGRELATSLAENLTREMAELHWFASTMRLEDAVGCEDPSEIVVRLSEEMARGTSSAGGSCFHRLLEACETPPAAGIGDCTTPTDATLDFRPIFERAGIRVDGTGGWIQPKTHRRSRAPNWRLLDSLSTLPKSHIEPLRAALHAVVDPELRHFGVACLDYFEGRFSSAVTHLEACLEADPRCEEYWILLAYSLRQLRRFDAFDDIVFGSRRDSVTVGSASR